MAGDNVVWCIFLRLFLTFSTCNNHIFENLIPRIPWLQTGCYETVQTIKKFKFDLQIHRKDKERIFALIADNKRTSSTSLPSFERVMVKWHSYCLVQLSSSCSKCQVFDCFGALPHAKVVELYNCCTLALEVQHRNKVWECNEMKLYLRYAAKIQNFKKLRLSCLCTIMIKNPLIKNKRAN